MQDAVRERTTLQVGFRTDPGRQRGANEDSLGGPEGIPPELLARKGWLYVVADGMGRQQHAAATFFIQPKVP